VLFWLWILHAVVLVGYSLTWAIDRELADRTAAAMTTDRDAVESALAGRS
jgi:membrane protein required for beta-lactamase induction